MPTNTSPAAERSKIAGTCKKPVSRALSDPGSPLLSSDITNVIQQAISTALLDDTILVHLVNRLNDNLTDL